MKKFILLLVSLLVMSASGFSQETIKFMGIPVDGTEREMRKALRKKGFTNDEYRLWMIGVFNGRNVKIGIHTVNNKVDFLLVSYFESTSEHMIIQTYNELYSQLYKNDKYIYYDGKMIDSDENLLDNLKRNPHAYLTRFYQKDTEDSGLISLSISSARVSIDGKLSVHIAYHNLNNATKASGEDL